MNDHEPQPSRPTTNYGAPDIGAHRTNGTWDWNDPEGRPATWNAFGQAEDEQ